MGVLIAEYRFYSLLQSRFAETLTLTLALNPNPNFGESGRHLASEVKTYQSVQGNTTSAFEST